MNKKTIGILGILLTGLLLGILASYIMPLNSFFGKDVSHKIENLYELVNPNTNVEVVKIDSVSGMYKVLFKLTDVAGGVTYREIFVSQDGKLLSESMVRVEESIGQINKIHDFVDCLEGKGVKIAGLANNTQTLIQFNTLGGSYATKLYVSCDEARAQECVNAGITQVPATIYEGKGYAGVQSTAFFENLTGCKS